MLLISKIIKRTKTTRSNGLQTESSHLLSLIVKIRISPEDIKTMSNYSSVISVSPEIMSGTPVFTGTRVPIQTLLDYLTAGDSIDDFLDGFPTVTREQVITFLEEAGKQMISKVA